MNVAMDSYFLPLMKTVCGNVYAANRVAQKTKQGYKTK